MHASPFRSRVFPDRRWRSLGRVLPPLALLIALNPLPAQAYVWGLNYSVPNSGCTVGNTFYETPDAACAACKPASGWGPETEQVLSQSGTQLYCRATRQSNNQLEYYSGWQRKSECPYEVGQKLPGTLQLGVLPEADSYCVNDCELEIKNLGLVIGGVSGPVHYLVVSKDCSATEPEGAPEQLPVPPPGPTCTTSYSSFGNLQVCSGPEGTTADDEALEWSGQSGDIRICTVNGCVRAGSDDYVIGETGAGVSSAAGSPNAPDWHDGEEREIHRWQITDSHGNGWYFYPSSETPYGGPSNPAPTSPNPTDPGGSGGTGGGTCGGPNQPSCKVEIDGDFEAPNIGTAPDFSESLSAFSARIQASPLMQSVAAVADAIPSGGTPPRAEFYLDYFGRSFVLEIPPPVLDVVQPIISTLSLLAWALLAIVIFMKA